MIEFSFLGELNRIKIKYLNIKMKSNYLYIYTFPNQGPQWREQGSKETLRVLSSVWERYGQHSRPYTVSTFKYLLLFIILTVKWIDLKMTILSLFTHPHVVSNLYDFIYSGVTKEYILKNDSTVFVHTVKVSVVQTTIVKIF